MDTSCGGYAIAALLEDRMGLVCDLLSTSSSRSRSLYSQDFTSKDSLPYQSQQSFTSIPQMPTNCLDTDSRPDFVPNQGTPWVHVPFQPSGQAITSQIPHETGLRSIYRSLCSWQDPPTSVAVCPQSQSVAFGCSYGIQLHWVDNEIGCDLNRWLPLSAPSDYLYFLPPKVGAGKTQKLRLVSSAAYVPGTKLKTGTEERQRRRLAGFVPDGPLWNPHVDYKSLHFLRYPDRDSVDNYRAVPLSDGSHILFTDPCSEKLCLGVSAPPGASAKLTRHILFEGPGNIQPHVYAAGRHLDHGVRIVASYNSQLWFFTVPHDIFACSCSGVDEKWAPYYSNEVELPHLAPGFEALRLPHEFLVDILGCEPGCSIFGHSPNESKSVWPLTIQGVHFADVPGVTEVAIESLLSQFTIWAFSADAVATAWQIRGGHPRGLTKHVVGKSGAIFAVSGEYQKSSGSYGPPSNSETALGARFPEHVRKDADGDIVMTDVPSPGAHDTSSQEMDLDGTRSRKMSGVEYTSQDPPERKFSLKSRNASKSDTGTGGGSTFKDNFIKEDDSCTRDRDCQLEESSWVACVEYAPPAQDESRTVWSAWDTAAGMERASSWSRSQRSEGLGPEDLACDLLET